MGQGQIWGYAVSEVPRERPEAPHAHKALKQCKTHEDQCLAQVFCKQSTGSSSRTFHSRLKAYEKRKSRNGFSSTRREPGHPGKAQ